MPAPSSGAGLWLARLATGDSRRRFGRYLLAGCAAGFLATGAALGWERWFFWAMLWGAGVFAPLRLGVELVGARGQRVRAAYREHFPDRITPANLPLVAQGVYEREVLMPRIVTPPYAAKVHEVVVAVGRAALARPDPGGVLRRAAWCLVGVADGWMAEMRAAREADPTSTNIQARWQAVRSLAVLAAAARILVSLSEELSGLPFSGPGLDAQNVRAFLDDTLAYLDRAALDPDVPPWTGMLLGAWTPEAAELRTFWDAYLEVTGPAPSRLAAVVEHLVGR
jgi:hypothetical protein